MLHKIKFSEFLNEFELDGNLQNGKYFTIGFVSIDVGLGGDFYRILQSTLSKKYQKLNISKVYDFKKLNQVRPETFTLGFKVNFTSGTDKHEIDGKCQIAPLDGKIYEMDI